MSAAVHLRLALLSSQDTHTHTHNCASTQVFVRGRTHTTGTHLHLDEQRPISPHTDTQANAHPHCLRMSLACVVAKDNVMTQWIHNCSVCIQANINSNTVAQTFEICAFCWYILITKLLTKEKLGVNV